MIKGMIYAAGIGSRLRPLTDVMPKALVEVGGVPMLGRVMERMARGGVGEIVVNVHHFADMVEEYAAVRGAQLGIKVRISDERGALLDTGGGLLAAAPFLADAEAIVVHNADILSDASLDLLTACHLYRGGVATLMVDPRRDSSRRLLFDADLRLHGRINLATGVTTPPALDTDGLVRAAFSGIHVASPGIFDALARYASSQDTGVFSITDFYASTAADNTVYGYLAERPSMWYDIGRPASLEEARRALTPQG